MQASYAEAPLDLPVQDEIRHRLDEAHATIRNHMYVAMGAGLIPIPVADLVALTGVQLDLIRRLSKIYDQPFFEDKWKKAISTLMATVLPMGLAGPVFTFVKAIPVVGYAAGVLVMPGLGGAGTYALGKVLVQHLESGGTFLDFDPLEVREHFRKVFEEGRQVASGTKVDAAKVDAAAKAAKAS